MLPMHNVYAAYYNPAGLANLKNKQISLGSIFIDPNLKAKSVEISNALGVTSNPPTIEDESPLLIAPHLGFAMPINEKIVIGIAAYVPYGLHLQWDDNPTTNPLSYNCYESWYYREAVTPTIAYKINPKLSVGFGISLGKGEAGQYLNSYALYLNTLSAGFPINVKEEIELTDDFNYSFNIGLMYNIFDSLTIGITYRSMTDMNFKGDLKFKSANPVPPFSPGKYDVSLDDVDLPQQVQIGLRYQPNEKVSLEADLVWTNWHIVDNQTLNIDDPTLRAMLQTDKIEHPRYWKDTIQVRLGAEWKVTDILTLRCGYFYDPSPIPDDTFDTVWPDADKKTYSIGVGLNFGKWQVDGVIQYTVTETDRAIGGESENLNDAFTVAPLVYGEVTNLKAEGVLWGYGITITYNF